MFWGLVDFVVRLANEASVRRALPDPVMRSKVLQEILDSKSQAVGEAPYQWGEG